MISFEEALEKASAEAAKYHKTVAKIYGNDKYWLFRAEREDGRVDKDNGAGSVYISKDTGEIRDFRPWDVDFTREFYDSAKPVAS